MSTQRIIYKNDNGGVSVIIPTDEAIELIGLDAIAKKDVPTGKPYKIVDSTYFPPDRAQRNSWVIDESLLTDGVGE